MKYPNYHLLIIKTLNRLHKAHPLYNIGKHISTALDGNDIWGVTDKELFLSLQQYEINLEMDIDHIDEEELEAIIKDGMNLETILFEEEED